MRKLAAPVVLILLNVAIVISIELTKGAGSFSDVGLPHLISTLFGLCVIVLSVKVGHCATGASARLAGWFTTAITLFTLAHATEAIVANINASPQQTILADFFVLLCSSVAFIIFLVGFRDTLTLYSGHKQFFSWFYGVPAVFVIDALYIAFNPHSLETNVWILVPLSLMALCLPLAAFLFSQSLQIGRIMSLFQRFMLYIKYSFLFFGSSVIFEFFEITGFFNLNHSQITHITHFALNLGFSFQFLSLLLLLHPKGIYADLEQAIARERAKIRK